MICDMTLTRFFRKELVSGCSISRGRKPRHFWQESRQSFRTELSANGQARIKFFPRGSVNLTLEPTHLEPRRGAVRVFQ